MESPTYRRLAWACLALAVPLRLYYFAGYGLGDDPNESLSLTFFAERLAFNHDDWLHYRVVNLLIRGLAYRWFGVSEAAFILPILCAALATHAVGIVFARDLMGDRGAFLTSLVFLVTPYESLAATANVPDYFHALCGLAAAAAIHRGIRDGRTGPMLWAGALLTLGFLNRVSSILFLPALALLTPFAWRRMAAFWASFAVCVGLVCLWDTWLSGNPVRWFTFNSGGGADMTSVLGYILWVYPRYLFGLDDHGHRMFAATAWAALPAVGLAVWRLVRRRAGAIDVAVVLGVVVLGGLVEFLPHRMIITGYWSHPRIFRYLAQLAPFVYLATAHGLEILWRRHLALAVLATGLVAALGLQQTPAVTEPLRDANRDFRALLPFLQSHEVMPGERPVPIQTDYWRINMIHARYPGFGRAWELRGVNTDSQGEKLAFLRGAQPGLVITGGATLPWYSGIQLVLSLSSLDLTPPPTWKLVYEVPGKVSPWRLEPLRVWRVSAP